jgi:hypothetical protein
VHDAVLHDNQQRAVTCTVGARLETHNLHPCLLRQVNPNIFRIFAYNLRDLSDVYCSLRNPETEPMWLTHRNMALAQLNVRWPAYESSHALEVWDLHILAGGDAMRMGVGRVGAVSHVGHVAANLVTLVKALCCNASLWYLWSEDITKRKWRSRGL